MGKQLIDIGTTDNDGTGDTIRSGGAKINANFDELFAGANSFRLISRTTAAQPGSPADGDTYLLPTGATGADWAGDDGKLAIWSADQSAWVFVTAAEGMFAWVSDQNIVIVFNGTIWEQVFTGIAKVRAATTAAITLASGLENGDAIDGVTLATGDRVLVKNQSSAAENGVYIVAASGAPTRAGDADSSADLVNYACLVAEGSANADKLFQCTTNAPITVGTTALTFAEFTSGGGGGGGGGISSGAAFPGSPASGDLFYNTTHQRLFQFDGTRWLSTDVASMVFQPANQTATVANAQRYPHPFYGAFDMWVDEVVFGWNYSTTGDWTLEAASINGLASNRTVFASHNATYVNNTDFFAARVEVNTLVSKNEEVICMGLVENSGSATIAPHMIINYRMIGA